MSRLAACHACSPVSRPCAVAWGATVCECADGGACRPLAPHEVMGWHAPVGLAIISSVGACRRGAWWPYTGAVARRVVDRETPGVPVVLRSLTVRCCRQRLADGRPCSLRSLAASYDNALQQNASVRERKRIVVAHTT